MLFNDFKDLNLPIGTKIKYKKQEWIFMGYGKNGFVETFIHLVCNEKDKEYLTTDSIYSWSDEDLEIIGYPVKYATLEKYNVGDIVYFNQEKLIVVESRDDDNEYRVYSYIEQDTIYIEENELSLQPTQIKEKEGENNNA